MISRGFHARVDLIAQVTIVDAVREKDPQPLERVQYDERILPDRVVPGKKEKPNEPRATKQRKERHGLERVRLHPLSPALKWASASRLWHGSDGLPHAVKHVEVGRAHDRNGGVHGREDLVRDVAHTGGLLTVPGAAAVMRVGRRGRERVERVS